MLHTSLTALIAVSTFNKFASASYNTGWTQYVDPFIGTEGEVPGTAYNGGNIFPGAVVPFGAVKIGPDTTSFNTSIQANAGYTPDGNVTAFSLTHVSGTGGGPVYGVVSQMPLISMDGVNVLDNLTYMEPRAENDIASVGYYKSTFRNGIQTELSASSHVGILQYTFPSQGQILVDVSHYLPSVGGYQAQLYSNGEIEISGDGSSYQGYGVYRGAFSNSEHSPSRPGSNLPIVVPSYQIYFCGKFDQTPASFQTFSGKYTDPYFPSDLNAMPTFGNESKLSGGPLTYQYGERVGAIFSFGLNSTTLKSKVGISWTSHAKACQFIGDEIPEWDLQTVAAAAKKNWNDNVLSTISISDLSNLTRLKMFYTALYHTSLMPTDITGDNPHWNTEEPTYNDYYTFWDTFRCLNSLILLILPERAAGIIRSAIDIWRHEVFMPDGRSGLYNGQVQGGSNADNVLADAYVKGLQLGINWTDGYAAMKTDAELTPYNTFDSEDLTASTKEGRGALPDWLNLGWISPTYSRSVSRTIEYALNDFSVAQVAKGIAPDEYEKYLNRSAGWQYSWQHNLTSLNFTGFLAPLFSNGSRDADYDPLGCTDGCEGSSYTYEALPWEYSWTVPFDMSTLITFMGGPATTEARLDAMFIPGALKGNVGVNGIGSTLFNPGNEPSFSTPLLYNYFSGRQSKSVLRSRQIVNQYYNAGRSGLPGNSDSGAIDSWMVWQMLGLYPVVTQPVYLITSPWFSDISISVGGNKTLRITAENLNEKSFYVQSLRLNGVEWDKSWLGHDDIKDGGALEYVLGSEPVSWDKGGVPPSPGHWSVDTGFAN